MKQRWRTAHTQVLAVVLLVLGGAACGGGSAHGPRTDVLGSAFSRRAQAVCETALARKKAQGAFPYPSFNPTQPDLSKLPAIGRLEKKTVEIYQTWLQRMRSLGKPPRGGAAWTDVLQALQRNLHFIADQQAAAARADGSTFTRDYYQGNRAQKDVEESSKAAGLPVCREAAAA